MFRVDVRSMLGWTFQGAERETRKVQRETFVQHG
jgi:hypothetical protein